MATTTTHSKVSNGDTPILRAGVDGPDVAKQLKDRLSREDERYHEDSQS
jgi:hypothetical protein